MKILFTIAGLQPEFGGPSTSVPALASALAQAGVEVDMMTCESSPGQAPPRLPPSTLVSTRLVPPANRSTRWRSAGNAFAQCLSESTPGTAYAVVHDHGLWLPNNHAVAVASRKLGIPRMVSPRGMLSDWARQHRSWKKRVAWWLFQQRDLESANVLHATSAAELKSFRAVGLRQPVAVIPNGVEVPPFEDGRWNMEDGGSDPGRVPSAALSNPQLSTLNPQHSIRTLLFLGRIHPIKGLLELVKAWASVRPSGWRVVIAGTNENNHEAEVKRASRELGVAADFSFPGAVTGDAKWSLYRQADLFVLPSHSENFGIVIAEALACGVPAIATHGTPWEELISHQCGWWADNGAEPLAAALREALACPPEKLRSMGGHGRMLVETKYSWPGIAAQMHAVYRWMLGQTPKPSCVQE